MITKRRWKMKKKGRKEREKYTRVVTIRLTEKQWVGLRGNAEKWGVRVVDMIRWVVDNYLES